MKMMFIVKINYSSTKGISPFIIKCNFGTFVPTLCHSTAIIKRTVCSDLEWEWKSERNQHSTESSHCRSWIGCHWVAESRVSPRLFLLSLFFDGGQAIKSVVVSKITTGVPFLLSHDRCTMRREETRDTARPGFQHSTSASESSSRHSCCFVANRVYVKGNERSRPVLGLPWSTRLATASYRDENLLASFPVADCFLRTDEKQNRPKLF